jgi:phosphomannomutase
MDLRDEAERWLAADPDPDTRAELRRLLDAGDDDALAGRFGARLTFGTAGIRGPLGAGPARMNRVVVRRVTAGIAAHLAATVPEAAERGVVVGYDARHKSRAFAEDVAGVFAAAGMPVRMFDRPVPTPLLAFAVRELDAAAGVQITASHNPAADNGYKVYWRGGAQITPPLDAEISAAIDAVEGPPAVAGPDRAASVDPSVYPAYVKAALAAGRGGVETGGARDLRVAYTPLHGVGLDLARGLLEAAGFRDVHVVEEQAAPDPDFPTVPFPNPEEPGALDLVLDLAARVGADLVLANDPDADRIAVAVPGAGGWRALNGDELGCLLAEDLLDRGEGGSERVVGTTVVSSTLLAHIAEHHGVGFVATLTGFKWLAAAAAEAEAEGRRMVLAYEQALGVMVGTAVRDKDGLSAALAAAELAARLKAEGRTLPAALDDLARRHGLHVTRGRSVRLSGADGPALVRRVLDGLRASPPTELAGVAVAATADYAAGHRTTADGSVSALSVPPADLFAVELTDGSRAQVRPSGTEPLLKLYFEVVEPVAASEEVTAARARAELRLERLGAGFVSAVGLTL